MLETTSGLPNTCRQCGADPGATWFAKDAETAQAGGGLCADCAGIAPQPVDPVTPDETDSNTPKKRSGVKK